MTEPAVTLTDFALGLECAVFVAILVWRHGLVAATAPWIVYFAAAGSAAIFGGLVHGYFLDPSNAAHAAFWKLALLAIGANAVAACWIGAALVLSQRSSWGVNGLSLLALGIFVPYVLAVDSRFTVAIAIAAPATLFLFAALVTAWRREQRPGALIAAWGVGLTLAAAAVQYFGIALDPARFNHNATAHVVQALSLALVFVGCLRLLDSATPRNQSLAANFLHTTRK